MPKIISYTPPWLSRPSPGYHLFSDTSALQQKIEKRETGAKNANQYVGRRHTIARRGTEIFVVVDNEIRWSDLCLLKDVWEEDQELKNETKPVPNEGSDGGFEPVDGDIAKRSYRV
jgi:nucleoporin NUP82